jgi:hypothetical protein
LIPLLQSALCIPITESHMTEFNYPKNARPIPRAQSPIAAAYPGDVLPSGVVDPEQFKQGDKPRES